MADTMTHKNNKVSAIFTDVVQYQLRKGTLLSFIFALCLLPCHIATAEVLRDPTRPPTVRTVSSDKDIEIVQSGPQLQAVIISENRRSAIISNRSVTMGDSIGGAQLIKINESEVVLRSGEKLQTLKLFPRSAKRTTASDHR